MKWYDGLKNGNGIDIGIFEEDLLLLFGKLLFFVVRLKG